MEGKFSEPKELNVQARMVAGTRNYLYRTFLGSERKAHMHLQPGRFMDPENPGRPCATKPKRLKQISN
jgi:hypothetical protein